VTSDRALAEARSSVEPAERGHRDGRSIVRRWLLRALVALAPLLVSIPGLGADQPSGPVGPDGLLLVPPLARVVDQPGVLSAADRANLEARLARFESDNGAQVAIVMVASTGVEPIEDFANRVGSAWKIGRHGVGDGLLLVVATQDRRARIEVARSLEGAIPDVVAKRVIQQAMAPHFRAGDYAGGLNAALDELLPRIGQERLGAPPSKQPAHAAPSHLQLLLPLLVVAVLIGSALRRALGAGGALVAGVGAGTLASFVLVSVALGALVGVFVLVLALVLGAAGRYGHAVGGPGGIYFPGSWGGGSGGGFGGGGFSSGGGGDFSGGGASGDW
jgi:uncharacterized protein